MIATNDETARGEGGHGSGLPGSATDARTQGALGGIMARERPDAPFTEPEKCFLISGIVIESSERSATVVGRRLCGKCRLNGF